MIIVAVIVTGANKGNFLNTLNQVLKYVNLEIVNQKSAQLFVLICGGILSAGLILFSAISRFLAASIAYAETCELETNSACACSNVFDSTPATFIASHRSLK